MRSKLVAIGLSILTTAGAAVIGIGSAKSSDAFPTRPIKIIIPMSAGAASDVNTRRYTEIVSKMLGQPIVIEPRPGGGGVVGAMAVKNSPSDGHTLFLAHIGTHAFNPAMMSKLTYDPIKDFVPIAMLYSFSNVLVVPGTSPAGNIKQLIELAKSKSGGLNFGSPGVGSGAHILGAMFQQLSGAPLVHVPYPGAKQQLTDIVAGRLDMGFFTFQTARPFIEDGRLKVLGSVAPTRRDELRTIPTLAESGFPDMVLQVWYGLVAPVGTPSNVVRRLHELFAAAGRDPQLIASLNRDGLDVRSGTAEEFGALIRSEVDKWGRVIKDAKICVN